MTITAITTVTIAANAIAAYGLTRKLRWITITATTRPTTAADRLSYTMIAWIGEHRTTYIVESLTYNRSDGTFTEFPSPGNSSNEA